MFKARIGFLVALVIVAIASLAVAQNLNTFTTTAFNISAVGTTRIITATSGLNTIITSGGFTATSSGGSAGTATFLSGTGSNCGTGQASITGTLAGSGVASAVTYVPLPTPIVAPLSQDVCVQGTGTQLVGGAVTWIKQ